MYKNIKNFVAFFKKEKTGPRLLTSGHFLQAKALCEILVGKGIRVDHTDVTWHSPEVLLVDVKGRMAEGFWLRKRQPRKRR